MRVAPNALPGHSNVYGPTPPEAVAVALPLAAPLQVTGTMLWMEATTGVGSVMFTEVWALQPLASVTVAV